jgi:capsular exopolysaccharide synthesis family protein
MRTIDLRATDKVVGDDIGSFSLLTFWRVLAGRKRFIVAFVIGFMAIGFLYRSLGSDTYTAESVILLENTSADLGGSASGESTLDTFTAIQVFGSRRVLETVAEEMNLQDMPEFNPFIGADDSGSPIAWVADGVRALYQTIFPPADEGTAEEAASDAVAPTEETIRRITTLIVESKVDFIASTQSRLILVRTNTSDPDLSANLSNNVSEAFLDELLATRIQAVDRLVEQLGRRVVELRQEVRDREAELQKLVNSVETVDSAMIDMRRDEAARLRDQVSLLQSEIARDRTLATRLEAVLDLPDAEIGAAIAQFQDSSDFIAALGDDVTSEEVANTVDEIQQRLNRRERLVSGLQEGLANIERQIVSQSADILRYQQLRREVEASEEILAFSVRRVNELSVQNGMEGGGGRIISRADPPFDPDGRGRVRVMVILGMLGLMTAIGWLLIREATNQTVRTPADLAPLLPETRIVQVPAAPRRRFFDEKAFQQRLLLSDATPYSEAVRRLRTAIMQDVPPGKSLTIHVASDLVSSGKSLLTISLARSCALLGKRVLVIEANMRQGTMVEQLKVERPQLGLEDVIAGEVELEGAVRNYAQLGIDLLFSGKGQQNPADLLDSPGFARLVDDAMASYDVVLIDTPPILAAPDALLGSRHADRTVFVAGHMVSTLESISDALVELPEGVARQAVVALYGADVSKSRRAASYQKKLAQL